MKLVLLSLLSLALTTSSAFAGFVTAEQVIKEYDSENLKPYILMHVHGVGSGMEWTNAYYKREGNKPIFCKPNDIPINAEGFYKIFEKEYSRKPEIYKDMPLAVPLIYGMISTYPCE